ncbi:MAG TPA: AraC family transcriptional regulator ligand-binding domain-containing protein [Mesorhizobium sp.]|jgi:AraC-like DNA-binding protein|uniref:AraC family transcriptional regulator n=1 Tax=Mesorhizobium sp. TaxID=1871066 RepID=UPI002DDD7E7B|nr:AraC family transcriptional regulator ligand-binding domain-containing protein [Mesorhizobium sp.]HEV2502742.1 AraC family transcriptional regulator ligand-binding domain-containing protein [Mesorhizobium sp.]
MHSYALNTTSQSLLRDLGVVPANVLRRAGLADDLMQQPSVRLATQDYYRLWHGIEDEMQDALLPIRFCEVVRAESFSPPLFAALCSPNLIVAAQRIARYKALVAPIRLDVLEQGDTTTVEFTWLDAPLAPPVSLVVMELLFCVTLVRMGTREAIRPLGVSTTVLPSPLAPYEAFLGAGMKRGASHAVTFSTVDARRPFLTSNEQLWAAFEPELRQRLSDLDMPVTTARRVRAALLEGLPSGLVSMEAIGRKLAMSKRTLQRRVEAEGTSYQQILNETREALARHYLEKTALPAAEIAFLLGFDEPNSFYRAFRSWTGTTPERIRQEG